MILPSRGHFFAFASLSILLGLYIYHTRPATEQERLLSYPGDLPSPLLELSLAPATASVYDFVPGAEESTITEEYTLDLTALCESTDWTPGLWLHCHSYCGANKTSICGGLNNARNRYQSCLRLAIDAGAGLILSSVTERDERDLRQTNFNTVCPDKFWDIQGLIALMGSQCPGLQFRMCDDRGGILHVLETPTRYYQDAQYSDGEFRAFVEETLYNNSLSIKDVNESNQAVINFGDSHIAWNYRAASELATIRKALFKVLNFNPRLLGIGTRILQSPGLNNGAFIGVHLRGEADWPTFYGTVEQQTWHYLRTIKDIQKLSNNGVLKTIYVSCGDKGAIQRFRDKQELRGYEVLDKDTLLTSDPKLLKEVEALNFDEKGIVEYQTLVHARYFLGIMTSTMSNTVAFARTLGASGDYFTDFIFTGSNRTDMWRKYPGMPYMAGDNNTRLMVFDGVDLMDGYP